MLRVCCDSWFWCQVWMRPITSAPRLNPNWQFCQYHRSSQTCLSWGGRLTFVWPLTVTRRCIFKTWCKTWHLQCACFLASMIASLSLCFDHKLSETEERVSVGLEHSCSELLQGQLWFNPLKKGLYLCDGAMWIAVLEGEDSTFQPFTPEQVLVSF